MAKNILKEAIADAKAVREVALANAKAALEEAFTPKLQSMLSAKLSETLNEEEEDIKEEEELDEMVDMDEEDTIDEADTDEKDTVDEMAMYDEDDVEENLDEEIDLEEILSELELDEDDSEDTMEEALDKVGEEDDDINNDGKSDKTDEYLANRRKAVSKAMKKESTEDFDLDVLLEEINNLGEGHCAEGMYMTKEGHCMEMKMYDEGHCAEGMYMTKEGHCMEMKMNEVEEEEEVKEAVNPLADELEETKAALETVRTELNEVNLLNSKLLYVNRIFKANNLNEAQKLRVVETLDNASNVKEAKLIYETIKDTFTISKENKTTPKKSIRENLGMASKAAGKSTAPKKEVISESNDMMARFQKLANIKINQ